MSSHQSSNFVIRAYGNTQATANKPTSSTKSEPLVRTDARYRLGELQTTGSRSQFVNMSAKRPFASQQFIVPRD